MKKLFVLFLLVALVPFSIGCWGDDDDDTVLPTKTLTLAKVLPANTFAGTLRGAVSLQWSNLFMNVVKSGTTVKLPYKIHTATADGVKVVFEATVYETFFDSVNGQSVQTEIQIQPTGVANPVTVVSAVTETLPALTSGVSADTPTSVTTVDTAAIEAAITAQGVTLAEKYEITSVKFGNTEIATKEAEATPLDNATTYTFVVTLSQAYDYPTTASPTWEIAVQNTAAGSTEKVIVNTTSTGPVKVTESVDKKTLTVVVTTDTTYKLTVGQTYSIVLRKTDAKVGGVDGVPATIPLARYIKIQ